ncbi:MAG: hypothetical protein AAGI14_09555 [Pseudomonadota bacterium]
MLNFITRLFAKPTKGEDTLRPSKASVLDALDFGKEAAEFEQSNLGSYFLETQAWKDYSRGDFALVLGPKGAGKSALYHLSKQNPSTLPKDTILISKSDFDGEFTGDEFASATSKQYTQAWRLYFIAQALKEFRPEDPEAEYLFKRIRETMRSHINAEFDVSTSEKIVSSILKYLRNMTSNAEMEFEIKTPVGTAKINTESDATEEPKRFPVSEIYSRVDEALSKEGKSLWITLDRLDAAFARDVETEKKALRGLIDATKAALQYNRIHVKLFLRSDFWEMLVDDKQPIREATHVPTVKLEWSEAQIILLMYRRFFHVDKARQFANLSSEWSSPSLSQAKEALYQLLPLQVDSGSKKPQTLDWVLTRLRDGQKNIVPRDVIYFLGQLRSVTAKKIEAGELSFENDSSPLFEQYSFKEAMIEVSRYKLEQFLYAEYPKLKMLCEALRDGSKTVTHAELKSIWGTNARNTEASIRQLVRLGFFSTSQNLSKSIPKNAEFTVPFIYRAALGLAYPY